MPSPSPSASTSSDVRILSKALFLTSIGIASLALYVGHRQPSVNYRYVGDCVTRETAQQEQKTVDQHQALVNALYACGIWKIPVG
jgi:hypothetical protein